MKLIGEWKEGKLTEGRWIYPNGLYWEGKFENNKPKGQGTWYFNNGNKLTGSFEQKPKVKGDDDPPSDDEEQLDADGNPIVDNFRPPQALNGRTIYYADLKLRCKHRDWTKSMSSTCDIYYK